LDSMMRVFDLTMRFGDLVAVDDMNSRMERLGVFEESCHRDEDDREMNAKILQMWHVYAEWIDVLGEDQLE